MNVELWKPCLETGKLIRAYLEVALWADKGSDSIGDCKKLIGKIRERLSSNKMQWTGTNGELSAAIKTLRKKKAMPSIKKIKRLCGIWKGKCDVS